MDNKTKANLENAGRKYYKRIMKEAESIEEIFRNDFELNMSGDDLWEEADLPYDDLIDAEIWRRLNLHGIYYTDNDLTEKDEKFYSKISDSVSEYFEAETEKIVSLLTKEAKELEKKMVAEYKDLLKKCKAMLK